MQNILEENNQVTITGEIVTELSYSHTSFGEKFFKAEVLIERLSTEVDVIPIIISERLLNVHEDYRCERIRITGQFRSYHYRNGVERHLLLAVFVKDIQFLPKRKNDIQTNEIFLDGYICRLPKYRITPKGREISDILLAVNRANGKADYIPCICWGRNARYMSQIALGGHVQIWGRIQSREYIKRNEDNMKITRIAYEVSVNRLS